MFVNAIEEFLSKGEINNTIGNVKKDYSDKINEIEEALLKYMGENDLKISKTEIPDKWKYLTENT